MSQVDKQFSELVYKIMNFGERVNTRNSDVAKLFGYSQKFESTPLLSVRKTAWKSALREWEWFMSGSSNIKDLHSSVRKWWEPWADKNGIIKNNYSKQFRHFAGNSHLKKEGDHHRNVYETDQVQYLTEGIKKHPNSRRNVISCWNTHEMLDPEVPLTNCHSSMIQADVDTDNKLHLIMYQRSNDILLGYPHNIIQAWAFLLYLAHQTGREVGSFQHFIGNAHIYENHFEMANKIVKTKLDSIQTPVLQYNPTSDDFKADDFSLVGEYNPIIKERLEMTV